MLEFGTAFSNAAVNTVGVVARSCKVGAPREVDDCRVCTLGGLEIPEHGAPEQTRPDLVALEGVFVVLYRQAHHVVVACGDILQVFVDDFHDGACRGVGRGFDIALQHRPAAI